MRLASLPFARQITLGAGAEPFTAEQVELHLQVAAERARRDLVRGRETARSRLLLRNCAGRFGNCPVRRDRARSCRRRRADPADCRRFSRGMPLVVLDRGRDGSVSSRPGGWNGVGSVVMLLHDRGPASVRLLEAAAQAAEAREGALTVICPPAVVGANGFETWIAERLAALSVRAQIEVAPSEPAALHRRIGRTRLPLVGRRRRPKRRPFRPATGVSRELCLRHPVRPLKSVGEWNISRSVDAITDAAEPS